MTDEQEHKGKTIYFAHPVALYDTPEEAAIIDMLHGYGWTVLNPNDRYHEAQYLGRPEASRFNYFFELVRECDAIAYMAFPDRKLGAGVAHEVLEAIVRGKDVYWVRAHDGDVARISRDTQYAIQLCQFPVLTIDETRVRTEAARGDRVKAEPPPWKPDKDSVQWCVDRIAALIDLRVDGRYPKKMNATDDKIAAVARYLASEFKKECINGTNAQADAVDSQCDL